MFEFLLIAQLITPPVDPMSKYTQEDIQMRLDILQPYFNGYYYGKGLCTVTRENPSLTIEEANVIAVKKYEESQSEYIYQQFREYLNLPKLIEANIAKLRNNNQLKYDSFLLGITEGKNYYCSLPANYEELDKLPESPIDRMFDKYKLE